MLDTYCTTAKFAPMATPILILSGPVGAGKTTVAHELVRQMTGDVVHIEGDVFWSFYANAPHGPTQQRFRTIMSAMTAAAIPFATAGSQVILDFSIPPWFLGTVRKIAAMRDVPLDLVILRPSEAVCAARAKARAEGPIDNYDPYSDLYRDFDHLSTHIVCDDTSPASDVAAQISRGIAQGQFRL